MKKLAYVLAGAVGITAFAAGQGEAAETDDALLKHGKELYQRECAACHGVKGDGEGPGAYILSQSPRNLELGVFKMRSTPTGQNPTDEDLFNTITHGIAGPFGAMMPSFASLSVRDRKALVAVVKDFALIDKPGQPITVPARPAKTNLTLGKQVYDRLQCASCHGVEGKGDGPSALTLKDDQKRRIWSTDFTTGRYKSARTPEDLYTRIFTGLDGSPMPGYGSKANPQELWALTEYVLSFGKGRKQASQD